jgi:Tfp pilus assembly protein PilV
MEVLIATVVVTVGIVAVMGALGIGLFASTDIEDTDLALNIAQAKMEEIKNTAFASLADSGPTADATFPKYSVTVNVAEGQDPMRIDVTVSWGAKGGTASIMLTTQAANV